MGDRANVHVKDAGVLLYTHWGGTALPLTVQRALARGKGRWGDEAYLARIVFCEMVSGDEMGDTGYGISAETMMCDNEHKIIQLDSRDLMVRFMNEDRDVAYNTWTMEEYVDLDPDSLEAIFNGEPAVP